MSDVEQVEEEIEIGVNSANSNRCVNVTLQIVFSTPGLVILVVIYSIMGALIFPLLEAPNELENVLSVTNSREECLKELWTITERLNVLYERNWTLLVHEQLRRFEGSIVAATKGGLIEAMGDRFPRWSFSEALLYSVTVITTIGHGNLTPRTSEGKIVTMLYALVGVPLMLMCLSSLGGFLADALQCAYSKLCHPIQRTSALNHSSNNKTDLHECIQQEDEMDCTVCKYDALCKESNIQSYDKYTKANIREDSCHLIRKSPVKSMVMATSNQHTFSPQSTLKNVNNSQHQYIISRDSSSSIINNTNSKHQHHQLNQIHHSNMENLNSNSNTYFPMNRLQSCHSHISQQINSNYHHIGIGGVGSTTGSSGGIGVQLQNQMVNSLDKNDPHRIEHHTATVHGLGRSKFLPKPLPQEINILLAECDVNCRHGYSDVTQNVNGTSTISSTSAPTALTTSNLNKCGNNMETFEDDDEDDDDNRLGCTHGTPSRIPLIKSSHHDNDDEDENNGEHHMNYTSNDLDEDNDHHNCNHTLNNQNNNSTQVPITLILIILISYICIGTVIFSLWENWTIVDGAYFCFVTLSTIGFGDLVPMKTFHGPELQLFACCAYLLLGLVLVAMSFSLLETQLLWKCKRMAVRLKLAND